MEDTSVSDFVGDTGQVCDSVRHLVPGSIELVGWGRAGRLDRMMLDDKRIELYHLSVVMEQVESQLAGNLLRDGCNGGEERAFAHVGWILIDFAVNWGRPARDGKAVRL